MAEANLQDNFEQRTDGSQLLKGGGLVIGTGPGAKSVVFQNDVGELHLAGNPTAGTVTLNLPATGGTLIMSGQAIQGLGVSTGGNTSGNTGTTIGTVVFAGGGIITLSQSTAAGSLATITISAAAAAGTGVAAIGVSTGGNTAGTTGTTQGTYVLAGGNNITLSQSTAGGSLATLTISAANSGTVVSGIGVSTGGNTAGNTGTTIGTIVFAGIGNVTLSQSTAAGSVATISISGGPLFRSYTVPSDNAFTFGSSDGGLSFMPVQIPYLMSATKIMMLGHMSGATGSSGTLTVSIGVYTLSGSTASLASSASRVIAWTGGTSTTNTTAYGAFSGTQYRTLSLATWNITPGEYLFAFYGKSSNAGSWTWFGASSNSIANAQFTDQSQFWLNGYSTSSFTTAMPASINITDTNYVRTGASAFRYPGFFLQGSG